MAQEHTPGPWQWHHDLMNDGFTGLFANDYPVVYPQRCNDGDDGDAWFDTSGTAGEETLTEADASLIAAAPDMLQALQEIDNRDSHIPAATWCRIQDAIAKASSCSGD